MKLTRKKTFFKGKAASYHTEVTATKAEQVLVWVVTIIVFIGIFASYIIADSFWVSFLATFLGIFIIMGTMIAIIFSKNHEEERKENEIIHKIDTKDELKDIEEL